MESLHNYQELFAKKGGHFDVIGLDMHATKSAHPFALRKTLPVSKILNANLTKRQSILETIAKDFQFNYSPEKIKETLGYILNRKK